MKGPNLVKYLTILLLLGTQIGLLVSFPVINTMILLVSITFRVTLLGIFIGEIIYRKRKPVESPIFYFNYIFHAFLLTSGAIQSIPTVRRVEDAPNMAFFFLVILLIDVIWIVGRHRKNICVIETGLFNHYLFCSLPYCLFNQEHPAGVVFATRVLF